MNSDLSGYYEVLEKIREQSASGRTHPSQSRKMRIWPFRNTVSATSKIDKFVISDSLEIQEYKDGFFDKTFALFSDKNTLHIYEILDRESIDKLNSIGKPYLIKQRLFFLFKNILRSLWFLSKNTKNKIYYYFCIKKASRLFLKYNPKVIFLKGQTSIENIAFIRAAKKMAITSVEVQHGVISKGHLVYSLNVAGRSVLTDEFLCYDDVAFEALKRAGYHKVSKFDKSVLWQSLGLGKSTKVKMKNSVLLCVQDDLLSPFEQLYYRLLQQGFNVFVKERRMIVSWAKKKEHRNFYESMCDYDYVVSIYSTVLVEAPMFGVKSVAFDYSGLATKYLADFEEIMIKKWGDDL